MVTAQFSKSSLFIFHLLIILLTIGCREDDSCSNDHPLCQELVDALPYEIGGRISYKNILNDSVVHFTCTDTRTRWYHYQDTPPWEFCIDLEYNSYFFSSSNSDISFKVYAPSTQGGGLDFYFNGDRYSFSLGRGFCAVEETRYVIKLDTAMFHGHQLLDVFHYEKHNYYYGVGRGLVAFEEDDGTPWLKLP